MNKSDSKSINFISSQPYESYFLWQLELQFYNFLNLGISSDNIFSLSPESDTLQDVNSMSLTNHPKILFFKDSREKSLYASSLRPNLIKKHLLANPEIYNNPIFYHDSDIIFRELPDFKTMLEDDIWYVSDTRSYMDSNFIKRFGGEKLLFKMSEVVGLSPEIIKKNDGHVGGAQYLMKNTSYNFWDKVEKDSEKLFNLLEEFNNEMAEDFYLKTGRKKSEYNGIQPWCADMWAVLWNAWLFGFKTKISAELDFCWADDPIDHWNKKKILHYTGVKKENIDKDFNKKAYYFHSPFYANLNSINKRNCGRVIANFIEEYEKKVLSIHKGNMSNTTFLIPFQKQNKQESETVDMLIRYIYKHFNTTILVIENNKDQSLIKKTSISNPHLVIVNTSFETTCDKKKYDNMIESIETDYIFFISYNTIISINQIIDCFNIMEESDEDAMAINFINSLKVDNLFKNIFGMVLDDRLLYSNKEKFIIEKNPGRALFMKKQMLIQLNENGKLDHFEFISNDMMKLLDKQGINEINIKSTIFCLS